MDTALKRVHKRRSLEGRVRRVRMANYRAERRRADREAIEEEIEPLLDYRSYLDWRFHFFLLEHPEL